MEYIHDARAVAPIGPNQRDLYITQITRQLPAASKDRLRTFLTTVNSIYGVPMSRDPVAHYIQSERLTTEQLEQLIRILCD